uniref:SKP1 component dimerisation domain-containing protein n=1 Tax=Meloidogyne javanica TaxID=6303 RepID=A0A915M9B3_MELJA
MSEESIVSTENGVVEAEENVQEPALYNYVLTEEQKQRKIKCVTWDDKVVEVEWHLMMQCGAFVLLWESLNLEDSVNSDALECFHFPLNEITEECFVKVVEWLRSHQGAQEAARCIMDKSAEQIRQMLSLPDDLTEDEKKQIASEYEYRESPPPAPVVDSRGTEMDEHDLVGTSSSFIPQSSSTSNVVYADVSADKKEVNINFDGPGSSGSS